MVKQKCEALQLKIQQVRLERRQLQLEVRRHKFARILLHNDQWKWPELSEYMSHCEFPLQPSDPSAFIHQDHAEPEEVIYNTGDVMDFSKFQRDMLFDPSDMHARRFQFNEQAALDLLQLRCPTTNWLVILDNLTADLQRLRAGIEFWADIERCGWEEFFFQPVVNVFLEHVTNVLGLEGLVSMANGHDKLLEVSFDVKGKKAGRKKVREFAGHADITFESVVHNGISDISAFQVIGELNRPYKASNVHPNYSIVVATEDKALIQLAAWRATAQEQGCALPDGIYLGFLTDLFSLQVSMLHGPDDRYYLSHGIVEPRSFMLSFVLLLLADQLSLRGEFLNIVTVDYSQEVDAPKQRIDAVIDDGEEDSEDEILCACWNDEDREGEEQHKQHLLRKWYCANARAPFMDASALESM